MYSDPMTREQLAEMVAEGGGTKAAQRQALTEFIRQQKVLGRMVERRVFVEPGRSRQRRAVFQFVATNLELPL